MSEAIVVLTTTETKEDAKVIAQEVLKSRSAACVQIVGPITSSYWWKEKIETSEEWLCVIKSNGDVYEKLESVIRKVHKYDVPEVLAMPATKGFEAYLGWLRGEIRS